MRWRHGISFFFGFSNRHVFWFLGTLAFILGASVNTIANPLILFNIPGENFLWSAGINNIGQIVGYYGPQNGNVPLHPFFRDANGTLITLPDVGTAYTRALGINDSGQIAGDFSNTAFPSRPFGYIDTDGLITTVNVPGSFETDIYGINGTGITVGQFNTTSSGGGTNAHGFLRNPDGTISTFDAPEAADTQGFGINDTSQIVGQFTNDPLRDTHGYLRNPDGTFTTLDAPGSQSTTAFGINDLGQVVGYFNQSGSIPAGPTGPTHGFLYSGGTYTEFDLPFCTQNVIPTGINDFGQITGNCSIGSTPISFIATTKDFIVIGGTTVPEPATWILMGSGLLGTVALRKRFQSDNRKGQ